MSRLKSILRWTAPGLVAGVLVVLALWGPLEAGLAAFVRTYGMLAYLGGLVLAWIFHRSRAFIVLALLGWLDLFVVGVADDFSLPEAMRGTAWLRWLEHLFLDSAGRTEDELIGAAVLGLLGVLALMRDRGVASRVGVLQLLGIAGATAIATALALGGLPGPVDPTVQIVIEELRGVTWPGFQRLTVLLALLAATAIAYGIWRYRGALERGLMWSGLLVLVASHPGMPPQLPSLLLMAAGLAMTVAVVEASYVMAYRDDLTGLPGRRALMQYLDGIQGTYTIAMVDVDHFKKFNDKHGHDVGDQVLRLVASRLGEAPGGGKAYRYGGEEFTLLYPGRTREDALPHLERVRESIQDSDFSLRSWRRPRRKPAEGSGKKKRKRSRKLSVTVSIGMADTTGKASDVESVLKKADKALYRAKDKGRNQVSK